MLDADCQVPAPGEHIGEKRVLGESDGVAVVEDRHRQLDHAGIGLHFLIAAYGDVHGDGAVIARRIKERQRLVADRPFARGEICDGYQRGERKQNGNSTFHVSSLALPPWRRSRAMGLWSGLCSLLSMI